jgi:adenylosuccinate lyase
MLVETTELIKNLLVYPDNMARNMNVYGGVVFSQRVLLALVGKGSRPGRGLRHCAVLRPHRLEHRRWRFPSSDYPDERVKAHLSAAEIDDCFDPNHHLRNLDEVYQRLCI